MGFAAYLRLLVGDTFLMQVSHSLTDPAFLTVDWDLALFFQLLLLGPVVDNTTQGSGRTGSGLVMIPTRWFEAGLLRVCCLQAGCSGCACPGPLGGGTVPGARGGAALLLEARRLIHDTHEWGVPRPMLCGVAGHLAPSFVFYSNIGSLGLEAI